MRSAVHILSSFLFHYKLAAIKLA